LRSAALEPTEQERALAERARRWLRRVTLVLILVPILLLVARHLLGW